MKIFRNVFISLFVTIIAVAIFLETSPGKKLVERILLDAVSKSGIKVDIGKIDGNLPYQIHLRDVVLDNLHFDEVDLTINLLHLLKGEFHFDLVVKHPNVEGSFQFHPNDHGYHGTMQIGTLDGTFDINDSEITINWENGSLRGRYENGAFVGTTELTLADDWKIGSPIVLKDDSLFLDSIQLQSPYFQTNGNFVLHFPEMNFDVNLAGLQAKGEIEGTQVIIKKLTGTIKDQQVNLKQPAILSASNSTPISLQFGEGTIDFKYDQENIVLKGTKIPLNVLSANTLEVPVGGELTIDASIHGETGQLKVSLNDALVAKDHIQGTLEASLQNGHLIGTSIFTLNQKPFLHIDANLPMTLSTHPFAIHPLMHRPLEGQISLHGKIEDIVDFFNTGIHRIEGEVDCEMKLGGKLGSPRLEGICEFKNGRYENYFTGTELTGLTGKLIGKRGGLELESLTGYDSTNGICTATGLIELAKYLPFHFDVTFSKLDLLQLDLITAEAEGKILLHGDLQSATAKGYAEVTSCDIAIPDKIPRTFPELQVVYKNEPFLAPPKEPKKKEPYPLNLDLHVDAPGAISINGRGLRSEWNGSFFVGGDYTNPAVTGKLELISGEFSFAGKPFKLIEGSIAMHGKAYEMPLIDIAANTSEHGISITARIKGPINTPQITFQSSPPLPLSAILSYLIFGKDLSDVSGLQALQLASTIANVAGEGIDVLEMTRKSLGVDRLQIVMTPSSLEEGADTISLEIGKVIFPGFLVAIRQGAEDSAPNIFIEVDLTHGFTLGLESQQQIEQGKFSLNWNINY